MRGARSFAACLGAVLVLAPVALARAQANVTIRPQRVIDARVNYGRCLLTQIQSGTKLDFGDAAIDGAMSGCDFQFKGIKVSIAADTSVPAEERAKRLALIDASAVSSDARREDARVTAFYVFMNKSAVK